MNAYRFKHYFNLHTLWLLLAYALICGVSYLVAFQLRFDFDVPEHFMSDMLHSIGWVIALKLILLFAFGQVDCVLAFFRLSDAAQLLASLLVSSFFLLALWYSYKGLWLPPRSVILTDLLISFLLLASFRVGMRIKASSRLNDWFYWDEVEHVIIIGAGEVGAGICSALKTKARFGMYPVAFLDDDPRKIGRYVHGVPIVGPVDELAEVTKLYSAHKLIIAFPSAPSKRIQEIVEMARVAQLPVESVPSLTDLLSGRAKITQLHPIEMEDLLGRKTVNLNSNKIRSMLVGKRVLVTGAGGSIGRELVAQILNYEPEALLCLDHAEIAIFNLQREIMQPCDTKGVARIQVVNVSQKDEMERIFRNFQPNIVFHAAAHKHVSLMEAQPGETLRNNFFASVELARLASAHAVERFILISTDKAINPTSIMGASKRLAELALLEQQQAPDNQTRFMAVRFGNVLGSSGSVIPIFKQQIEAGGPVTVTSPEVTRFFMTVQEAVGLVLQSATQGQGGELFVLDMGEPVKIIDVARQMIALSGCGEDQDIDIQFTGLKPGEKLYEEVQHLSETLHSTDHPQVMRFVAKEECTMSIEALRAELDALLPAGDSNSIKQLIQKYVPEYKPYLGM